MSDAPCWWDPFRLKQQRPPPGSHTTARELTLGTLLAAARTGDLILFRCKMLRCIVQRAVTGAEWDHAGVVVRSYGELYLCESIACGVSCFPLGQRLREYGEEYAEYMVWRPLHYERNPAQEAALSRFVDAVDGCAFSMDVVAMAFTPRQAATEGEEGSGVEPAYFCSQLVTAAWKACGLLQSRVQPASFWPGDCAAGGAVEAWLADGVRLGPERLIDWRGHAVDRDWLACNPRAWRRREETREKAHAAAAEASSASSTGPSSLDDAAEPEPGNEAGKPPAVKGQCTCETYRVVTRERCNV